MGNEAGQLREQREYGSDPSRPLQLHRFKRDLLGRLTEKTSRRLDRHRHTEAYSRSRYDYDPFSGNLVKARNGHSSIELAYDALDRLVGETTVHHGQSSTVRYHYDPLGNLRTELPDGGVLEQQYYPISCNDETVSDLERDVLHQQA